MDVDDVSVDTVGAMESISREWSLVLWHIALWCWGFLLEFFLAGTWRAPLRSIADTVQRACASFCPEVSIGLGIPRETIRLVNLDDGVHCVGTKTTDLDVTEALKQAADDQRDWHAGIYGYILKKDSPSCGMERVRLYKGDFCERKGVGIYAERLMQNFPNLPIEEEGRL